MTTENCQNKTYVVVAHLRNGASSYLQAPAIGVPGDFDVWRALWERRGIRQSWPKDQWALVRASIEPFLYATIDPEDVHYDNGLLNPRSTIQAQSVELTSVSFESGPIPVISGYARFVLSFDRRFKDNAEFCDWMEATDWLDWGTNFGWRFPSGDEFDASETHDGIELQLLFD